MRPRVALRCPGSARGRSLQYYTTADRIFRVHRASTVLTVMQLNDHRDRPWLDKGRRGVTQEELTAKTGRG